MSQNYDLIVIGGGSAGLTAAGFAAQLGKKVALVEANRLGGECTWTGCIPSKALLRAARVAHDIRSAEQYGIGASEPIIDIRSVMDRVRSVIDQVYQPESPDALRAKGIDVHLGHARFVESHTINVDGTPFSARRFIIATGAHPFIPAIEGLDTVDYWTYEDIWGLEGLPQRMIVIGGGPIGCELAQGLGRLGAGVSILEDDARILPQEDPKASEIILRQMARDGIQVILNSRAQRVWSEGGDIHIVAGGQELASDSLLLSVGRRPTIEGLDLEKAGVNYTHQGVAVNRHLRTSQRHIYAAGDCTGGYQFTHYAGFQGFMAARNALLPGSAKGVMERVPYAVFTDPEVARIGLTESEATERYGKDVVVCEWPMQQVDRAIVEGDTGGFIKIVHQPNGRVLGVTIVNARAGEMIHEWILAIDHRLKLGDLVNSLHIYPTYSIASQQAALQAKLGQMLSGVSGKMVRGLARLNR